MENSLKFIKNILYGLVLFTSTTSIMAMAEQPNTATNPAAKSPEAVPTKTTDATKATTNPARFCPFAKELTKEGMLWKVGKSWKSDNDSFIKEIASFVGAQWSGVKYGTIICLYQGKENIDFPVSIQPIHSTLVLEPSGIQWSGLVKNRKLCKSVNVYDCPFFVKPQENITDIYKQIEYKGTVEKGILNEPQY